MERVLFVQPLPSDQLRTVTPPQRLGAVMGLALLATARVSEAQWAPRYLGAWRVAAPAAHAPLGPAPSGVGSSLLAELSFGTAGAILGWFLGSRIEEMGTVTLAACGAGAMGGVVLGAYATHRRPSLVGMVAGTAAVVVFGIVAGDAASADRSERAGALLAWAHVLTVPAAAIGSHISF